MSSDLTREFLQQRRELFGFIRAFVHSTADADDIFQEVALVIIEKAKTDTEIHNFRAWSHEIARRKTLEFFRKQRHKKELRLPSEEMQGIIDDAYVKETPEEPGINAEHDALHDCLKSMSGKNRKLLSMRFMADKSYEEMAGLLKKTETAIRRASARARLALADCMQRKLGRAEVDR
jgi:RNA polymerase sigma-70 factor (ECF subfamily)